MIMVGCPIYHREEHVEGYVKSLLNLDFDLKQLRVVFLAHWPEGDLNDDFITELLKQQKEHGDKFGAFEVWVEDEVPAVDEKNRNYQIYADLRNLWINLRKDEEFIFSIDSDVRIPKDSLKKLINHNKDIVSVVLSNAPEGYEVYNFFDIKNDNIIRYDIRNPRLVKCDVTGAAYLIKSKVLDSGVKYGYHRTGEDAFFCLNAKSKGFSSYCDTSIKAEHLMGERSV